MSFKDWWSQMVAEAKEYPGGAFFLMSLFVLALTPGSGFFMRLCLLVSSFFASTLLTVMQDD